MEERSMLKNQVLKTIAFLTLPIFAMIIIVDCIIIYYAVACPEIKENKDFYDTDMFIDSYMGEVERKGLSLKDEVEGGYFIDEYGYWIDPLEDSDRTPIYVQDGEYKIYYQTNHTKKKFIYLLVNEETKIAYTNIQQTSKTNTIEKLKQVIISNNKYWSISNNQIQTNVERLSEENIVRNEDLQKISEFSMNKQYYTCLLYTSKAEIRASGFLVNSTAVASAINSRFLEIASFISFPKNPANTSKIILTRTIIPFEPLLLSSNLPHKNALEKKSDNIITKPTITVKTADNLIS